MGDLENDTHLLSAVKEIIREVKQVVWRSNKPILLNMYWRIGQMIVEDEQHSKVKATAANKVDKLINSKCI